MFQEFYSSIVGFHSDVLKLQNQKPKGVLNFYLSEVEDDLEINLFSSFQFHDVFRFENTAF